jgi:hypothetical protein
MALVNIGGGHSLVADAAASYERMRDAGCPSGINSSTRSYEEQKDWYEHQGEPGYPPVADHPDRSKHVYRPQDTSDQGGRALDLPEPARGWVRAHGAPYGWMKDRVGGESWHMEYEVAHDTQEDEMSDSQYKALKDELEWIHKRLGGSTSWDDVTTTLTEHGKTIEWLHDRVGGSTSWPDITKRLDEIEAKIEKLT